MTEGESETMDTTQVADYLEVSKATVQRLVIRKDLHPLPHNPVLRRAQRLIFMRDEVVAYKAKRLGEG